MVIDNILRRPKMSWTLILYQTEITEETRIQIACDFKMAINFLFEKFPQYFISVRNPSDTIKDIDFHVVDREDGQIIGELEYA